MSEEKNKTTRAAAVQINMNVVEELTSAITRRQITVDRFRFNLSLQDALNLLAAHYKVVVERRLGKFILDENTNDNLLKLATYLTNDKPKFGVMMCGTCGNGKTTLLYALQSAINYLNYRNHFNFLSEYFNVGMEVLDVKDIIAIASDFEKLKALRLRSMLAIDDLGKEPAELLQYGNIKSPVVDLLEFRYAHQLFTCITTNLVGKEIREKYGERIADRFNEMLEVIVFQDISYRR